MGILLEACVGCYKEAKKAELQGADRIELCDNLGEGGTTPSYGTIYLATQNINIPIAVIIRPRGGDFVYSNDEFEIMKKDIVICKELGVETVVFGILNKENKKNAQEIVRPYFKEFGLEGYEDKYPSELSGGMKQRANFLRTFINSNDLMLLDEPFGALDSITKTNMQKWLLNVREKFNSTIILITHDIEEAITLSDRIYLISQKPSSIKAEFILEDKHKYEFGSSDYIKLKKDIISLL